jgi:hypothetical protein
VKPIVVTEEIEAPIKVVFDCVSTIRQFKEALPHIVDFEYLTEMESDVGTRFRETRLMKGQERVTELEVTEYDENNRVRMVADTNGTVWDTTFVITGGEGFCTLVTTMHARAYKWLPKLMNPLIRGMIAKFVEKDMDLVKAYCKREHR